MRLKTKVLLLALVPVLLFALVLSGAATKVLLSLADGEVTETRERLTAERQKELQNYMQIALGSVQSLYDAAAQGDMDSRAQAIVICRKSNTAKTVTSSPMTPISSACFAATARWMSAKYWPIAKTPTAYS